MADGSGQTEHLLHLKLDGVGGFGDLLFDLVVTREESGELASTGEGGSEQTGDLTDENLRGEESIELGGQALLDQLLVAVQGLEIVDGLEGDVGGLGGITMLLVTENAELHRSWGFDGVGQALRAGETLVLLRIVVLQVNLKLNGLSELTDLSLKRILENAIQGLREDFAVQFAHCCWVCFSVFFFYRLREDSGALETNASWTPAK